MGIFLVLEIKKPIHLEGLYNDVAHNAQANRSEIPNT